MKRIFLIGICLWIILGTSGCSSKRVEALNFDYDSEDEHYDFQWSNPDEAYMQQLVQEFKLKELVKDSKDDLEKVLTVSNWVHNLWKHDGNNTPEKGDPISILRAVEAGERFRCVEYAVVIEGCLNALGIPARRVGLKTEDVETRESGAGHVVVEAYLNDLDKWVFVDGQWDAVPALDGKPLNGVEFQKALSSSSPSLEILSYSKADANNYFNWIGEYLYYFDIPLDNRIVGRESYKKLMLVPIGSKKPKVFQIKMPIGDVVYTNSVKAFYEKPQRN